MSSLSDRPSIKLEHTHYESLTHSGDAVSAEKGNTSDMNGQIVAGEDSESKPIKINPNLSLKDRLQINKNLLEEWKRLLDDYDMGKLSKADPVTLKNRSSALRRNIKQNVAELNHLYLIQHPSYGIQQPHIGPSSEENEGAPANKKAKV